MDTVLPLGGAFLASVLATCKYQMSVFWASALGGSSLGLLTQMLKSGGLIASRINSVYMIAGVGILVGFLTLVFEKLILIPSIAFSGGFLVALSIDSIFLKYELNARVQKILYSPIDSSIDFPVDNLVYVMVGGVVVFAIIGSIIQFTTFSNFKTQFS